MRAFTTRIHALLDYALALLLMAMPWIAGFAQAGPATWIPVAVGAVLLLYSLGTDYELGAVRRLQMPVHLWLDGLVGLLLAVSPWLFAFEHRIWAPHLAAGVALMAIAVVTDTIPGYERRRAARADAG